MVYSDDAAQRGIKDGDIVELIRSWRLSLWSISL